MEHNNIDACIEEWETLSEEYKALEKVHKEYRQKLEELTDIQQKCIKGIAHQRYRINIIKQSLKRDTAIEDSPRLDHKDDPDNEERNKLLQTDLIRRKAQLYDMENNIPKPSGLYLKIILGNINVSILNKDDKYRYKDEYEKFKLVINLVAFAISTFNIITNFRTADLIHMFLLVWYYCTLTIRESILKHVELFVFNKVHKNLQEVQMISKRKNNNNNALFAGFVQYLQFMYQRGCLYRLKALGERHNMDITIEGFHSWMWRGLGFILPFLFVGYFWELYNAYTLYLLSFTDNAEWHVSTLAVLFLVLFLGNTLTTISIIPQKIKERMKLKYRFTRLDKYIWTHKKQKVSFRNPESPQRRTPAARAASFNRKKTEVREEEENVSKCQEQQANSIVTDPKVSKDVEDQNSEAQQFNDMLDELTKDIDFVEVDKENEEEPEEDDLDDQATDEAHNVKEEVETVSEVSDETKKDK
ncbi:transmembrane protein 120 homolog [Penaeus chinensis]|uniref:transmembrane protein 120 homolog n=1 Tax=Penaeus chinensis TaxID=139456 RepID=UPI001FB746D0|nr:transmembrane protein 120 homolog [Penaeus chinensis]